MKTLLISMLLTFSSHAGVLKIVGPCSKTPVIKHDFSLEASSTVGKLSVDLFDEHGVPYIGSELGINSILDTPTGSDAMEIISNSEMLAYGWCYSVNGFEPGEYPNKVAVKTGDEVLWWFGYAHYKDGEWIAQCTPSYQRMSPKFCN